MSKAVKIGAGVLGILVLLFVVAIVLLVTLVNPNNFKNQISAAVQKNTGREFIINGNIKWSFFPWLGLRLNQITLGNAPGFGQQPFAQLGEADVDIRLLPLFIGKVEIGTVSLKDLTIHLVKNTKGENNWSILRDDKASSSTETTQITHVANTNQSTSSNNMAAALLISDVDINHATITWEDQQTGQNATLSDLTFTSSNVNLNKLFPVKLKFHLMSNKPVIDTYIDVSSKIYLNPSQQKYALQQLIINGKLVGNQYKHGSLPFNLNTNIDANLQRQTLEVQNVNLSIANMEAHANFSGNKILTDPLFQGSINVPRFNLRAFLTSIGEKVNPKDATALQDASLKANTEFSLKFVKLSGLKAILDDTKLTGIFTFANSNPKTFNFDLNVNQIDLDRYSSLASTSSASAQITANNNSTQNVSGNNIATSQTTTAAALPVALLRQLSGSGTFKIGKLVVNHITSANIVTQMTAKNGVITISPMTADLYQGKSEGTITLDVRSAVPALSLNESLSGIQVGFLMSDLAKKSKFQITGTGNLSMNLQTQGINADAMTRALNGNIKFAVTNGAVKNLDIRQLVYAAIAHALKQNAPADNTSTNQTAFSSLTGTVTITNGIANNNDLSLKSTALQVDGDGSANLINQTINYNLKAKAMGDPFGKDIFALQDQIGGSIPMTVSGTFSDPKVQPDYSIIATALLKGKVQQQIEQHLPQIGKNLPKSVDDAIKGLQNILGQ